MEDTIQVADRFITAIVDDCVGLKSNTFKDRLADLITEERLKAIQNYQKPGVGFGNPPETSVPLTLGTLQVPTTEGGFCTTDAYFFNWEGIRMAATKSIDPMREGWVITEPKTGLAIPDLRESSAVECYASFMKRIPDLDKHAQGRGHATIAAYIKEIMKDSPTEARVKHSSNLKKK